MILIVPKSKRESYQFKIERDAHHLLPIRKIPFYKYLTAAKAAALMYMSVYTFLNTLRESNTMHGFRVQTGEVYVHPDQVLIRSRRRGMNLCKRIAKSLDSKDIPKIINASKAKFIH